MPFKLKLKKTRQYNVASKSLFVISVELLDGGVADCTLSVDSSGQECLDNVCQRQAINQPEFFGLRYLNRNQQPRWVQLDRPLKRQLDKNASSHQLYLRVMYYVISGTSLITDEVTRYHYFLQLKNDLIEGRIICDLQQAVVLASYSRQAEYGNHDRERHTVEYLKNLLTFPKQMLDGGQIIDGSTLAETGRLEWLTEAVIQHHMALHNMSQAQAEEGFITTCQQLRGYGQEMYTARSQVGQAEVTLAISLTGITLLTDNVDSVHFYRWMDITNVINHKRSFSIECQKQAQSASFTLPSPEDGKYVWRMCVLQHTFFMKHRETLSEPPLNRLEHRTNFQEHGLSESREELDVREVGSVSRLEPLSAAHRAHSTSCLELAERHQPPQPQPVQRNRALLPSYRPAPDYDTAVQQKYAQQRADAQLRYQNHHAHTQLVNTVTKPIIYGSHPDIHRIHYPDVTRHTLNQAVAATDDYSYGLKFMGSNFPFAVNPNVQTDLNQLQYINVYKPPPPYPSNGLASNSTPDLAVASQALNYHRGYINSHVSGSSPDLVSTRTALNRQYLGYLNNTRVNYRPVMPGNHGTYNNLPSVMEPKPRIIIDPHHISDNIQKMYDERGNIMYSMQMHRIPYQRHLVLPQQVPGTQEPIYENVPLPWQNDANSGRDRAHSLTTTDEIARINERNLPKPIIPGYIAPENHDGHYVNAHIMNRVRESSLPKEINPTNVSISRDEIDNVTIGIDQLSVEKDYDETPYQSLSTHKLNNNTISKSSDNVTSINVADAHDLSAMSGQTAGGATATSGYSTTLELDNTVLKEKKRRRWGMFAGKAKTEVKSATLGRDRAKGQSVANKHRWSTGLPKCQPLPPSITKETMCQILERKLSDEQLAFAFEQIPKGRDSGGEFVTALAPQCALLNAHCAENLPYEDNRVRLHPTPANPYGYINASHITMTVGSTQRFYVVAAVGTGKPVTSGGVGSGAGSGPSALEQAALVWECMWQVGTRLVALVGGHTRPHYLPADNTTADYGKFKVRSGVGCAAAWGSSVRVWVSAGTSRARALWHVQFTRWTDSTPVPDRLQQFLEFVSEVSALRASCEAEGVAERAVGAATAPLAFCCSNGARAGLALASHLLLDVLEHNQELDIPRTVGTLHHQRANLIQNVHQYKFLHQLLLLYLQQSRLI